MMHTTTSAITGHIARRPRKSTAREWVMRRRGNRSVVPLSFLVPSLHDSPHGGRKSVDPMSHTRPDPAPKPDHIRTLRDLAAGFVRAIDRTALDFEAVATSELTERVACLVALHELEMTDAELTKTPTATLRQRLNLLRQVERANSDGDIDYETRRMTNGELKKRIEYLRQFVEVKGTDDLEGFTDEALTAINAQSADIIKARKWKAKAEAKAAEARTPFRVVENDEEEDADVADIIGNNIEAA